MTIHEIVFSKYNSVSDFASAIGWQKSKAARIVNADQTPSKKDMEEMIHVLNIPAENIAPIFFGAIFSK